MRLVRFAMVLVLTSGATLVSAFAQPLAPLAESLADACSRVDRAQIALRDGPNIAACWAAIDALFAGTETADDATREALGLAFTEAVRRSAELDRPHLILFLSSEMNLGTLVACTEGYRTEPIRFEECMGVLRAALTGSQILSEEQMAGLGNFLCELTAFAPTVYLPDIRAVIDEIVARGVAGTDPVIRGPYGPVGVARANCGF